MHRAVLFAALIAWASPAAAQQGLQYVVTFEGVDDIKGVAIGDSLETLFSCKSCEVRLASDPAFPAVSPTHQVYGGDFNITVTDPVDISWPAMGAYVTGLDTVYVTFTAYDYALGQNVDVATLQTSGSGAPNEFVGVGFGPFDPICGCSGFDLTGARFYSARPFTLDDVIIGRPDQAPGIPEPAGWLLMILGFGLLGSARRLGRARVANAGSASTG